MKKRVCYTASRRNPMVWLSALTVIAAAAGYIANAVCGGAPGVAGLWLRVILPVLACLYFTYQLLANGKERVFRLSLPFWMLGVSLFYALLRLGLAWYWTVLLALALAVLCVLMHRCLNGTFGADWMVIVISGLCMAAIVWFHNPALHARFTWTGWLVFMPDLIFLCGYILLCFGLSHFRDNRYHPTWGDRFDGRRVRSLSPISVVGSYVMPERNQANVFFQDTLEISRLERYIRKKRESGMEDFGMTEVLLAAYVRTVSKFPGLNRFLSGQKIFNRDEDIQFCMTVKKEMTQEAPDTVIKIHLRPGDGVPEVYKKFHEAVAEVRKSTELDSSLDGVAALIGKIPGVVLKFVIWLLKLLDYFGLLPRFLLEVSPFHGSIFFTSMGSLGIPPVYHHLYNFGNLPIFLAFGKKYRKTELDEAGQPIQKRYMDYAFNVDERTVDGFYYATTIKYFHKLLLHPERLDDPEMEINRDIP